MKNLFDKVKEFNKSFNILEHREFSFRIPDENEFLYSKLLLEENMEYAQAVLDEDLVDVADALADQMYILIGTVIKHGMTYEKFSKLFDEVHKSNMSKLDEHGKPIYRKDGKVLKGPNYFKPDVRKCL